MQLVSHELRTSLTEIRGSVHTLMARRPHAGAQQNLTLVTARATVWLEEMLNVVLAAVDRPDPRPLRHGQLELASPEPQLELAVVTGLLHRRSGRPQLQPMARSRSVGRPHRSRCPAGDS